MNQTFQGRIALDEGGDLDVDLHLTPTTLSIESGSAEIGSWPLHLCHIELAGGGVFDLGVDGDAVRFTPVDVETFEKAVATAFDEKPLRGLKRRTALLGGEDQEGNTLVLPELQPIKLSATDDGDEDDEGWVSEDILESQRSLRESTSVRRLTPALLKKLSIALGIAAIVGLAAWQAPKVLASVDLGSLFASDPVDTTTTTTLETTTSSTGPSTTTTTTASQSSTTVDGGVEAPVGVFAADSNLFVDSWNSIGGAVSPALKFPAYLPGGEFENQFTTYLGLSGVVGADGKLRTYTLTIDPSGPSNSDVLGINALGVAVAVTEPDLDGPGRKSVLASLGLNVESPSLAGIDSEVVRSGVRYELVYDAERNLLTLTVSAAA